jgi:DNA replication protein DnaC
MNNNNNNSNKNKFVCCRECINGYIFSEDREEAKKCTCLIKWQEKIENESIINNSNLPVQITNYSIENYIGPDNNKNISKLKKFIDEFETKYKSIHLYAFGKNSVQKTTVLSWVGKELAKNGFTVYYSLMNELIKDLVNFQFKPELEDKIERYNNVDCLILDESFDINKVNLYKSGYQLSFLDEFLRNRLERNKKSTIFISNINYNEINESFGISLSELIKRNCSSSNLIFEDSINLQNNFNVEELWK